MASLLYTVGSALVNATAFGGGDPVFSMLREIMVQKKNKRYDLAIEGLQRARDKRNENQMEWLNFIDKRLPEKNEAKAYVSNADDVILEYYRVFAKKLKPLPPEPLLSDFGHPSKAQKNGELLFLAADTGIVTYALYNYLK